MRNKSNLIRVKLFQLLWYKDSNFSQFYNYAKLQKIEKCEAITWWYIRQIVSIHSLGICSWKQSLIPLCIFSTTADRHPLLLVGVSELIELLPVALTVASNECYVIRQSLCVATEFGESSSLLVAVFLVFQDNANVHLFTHLLCLLFEPIKDIIDIDVDFIQTMSEYPLVIFVQSDTKVEASASICILLIDSLVLCHCNPLEELHPPRKWWMSRNAVMRSDYRLRQLITHRTANIASKSNAPPITHSPASILNCCHFVNFFSTSTIVAIVSTLLMYSVSTLSLLRYRYLTISVVTLIVSPLMYRST